MDAIDPDVQSYAFSAVIINYNGSQVLADTVQSIRALRVPPVEIIVVDDGSSDDGIARLRDKDPDVQIVELPKNTGRTSIVRNTGLKAARERYILVTDNDITFTPGSVDSMMNVMQTRENVAACTPAVLFNDGSEEVYVFGHKLHFLCWSQARVKESIAQLQERGPILAVGCGIGLFDTSRLAETGYFNEKLILGWGDDGELHHRIRMFGHACYAVPDAVIYHNRIRTTPRIHGMIHNRLVFLVSNYRTSTLFLLFPALLCLEILLVTYSTLIGQGRNYRAGWASAFRVRKAVLADRRRLQSERRVEDRALFEAGPLDLRIKSSKRVVTFAVKAMNGILDSYWSVVRKIL